jgi:hypothetical protein
MPQGTLNQQDWRIDANIEDQYGRLWLISFETGPNQEGGSQMPTGQILAAGWSDPLATPQIYFRIPRGKFGSPDRNSLLIDYAPWLAVQRQAERDWKMNLNTVGMRHYKSAYNPRTAEQDEFLMSVQGVGPKPWPPSSAIARAMRGDKAMLGLSPLSKEDRKLLGKETDEDLGFASEPTMEEESPMLPPVPKARAKQPMTFWKFAAKMKKEGITQPEEIKGLWAVYKAEAKAEAVAA